MIIHTLWKEKPKVTPPAPYQPPSHLYSRTRARIQKITSQAELDAYWGERPMALPTFVKWYTGRQLGLFDLGIINCVVAKQTDFKALETNYYGEPAAAFMFNCSLNSQIAARWDCLDDWIPITQEEFDLIVKPHHDALSVKIQHWQALEEQRVTRSSQTPT